MGSWGKNNSWEISRCKYSFSVCFNWALIGIFWMMWRVFFLQSCIVVEVPPYHSKTVASAVQVQFYVCNGKRKRSQSQRFTYLSGKKKKKKHCLESHRELVHLHFRFFFFVFCHWYKQTDALRQVRLASPCSSVILSRACVHSFGSAASCLLGQLQTFDCEQR